MREKLEMKTFTEKERKEAWVVSACLNSFHTHSIPLSKYNTRVYPYIGLYDNTSSIFISTQHNILTIFLNLIT